MRAVIQRVRECSVRIGGEIDSSIGKGLMILVGIEDSDTTQDIDWLTAKIAAMRIFDDENGVMNLSAMDIGAEIMVISQFTLMAQTRKGNRPSYIRASKPEFSKPMYQAFCEKIRETSGLMVQTGVFGADMKVSLINDGPVTIVMDTKNKE